MVVRNVPEKSPDPFSPLQKQWKARVKIAKAPNGRYAMATGYSYALGGGGSPVSVWNRHSYESRDEAFDAGIRELIKTFETVRDQASAPKSQAALAVRMIELLLHRLAQAGQFELF